MYASQLSIPQLINTLINNVTFTDLVLSTEDVVRVYLGLYQIPKLIVSVSTFMVRRTIYI